MPFVPLALPGADVLLDDHWLDGATADALLADLHDGLPWEVHRIRLFGREVPSPRLSLWIGDPGAVYRYSGTRFEPRDWPASVAALRERVSAASGCDFDSVLANLYRNGQDAMGWHADDEPELGPRPVIASLSLGATRTFAFKAREGDARLSLPLVHGSLLVMRGDTQRLYRHALPRTRRVDGPRINLTFRRVGGAAG